MQHVTHRGPWGELPLTQSWQRGRWVLQPWVCLLAGLPAPSGQEVALPHLASPAGWGCTPTATAHAGPQGATEFCLQETILRAGGRSANDIRGALQMSSESRSTLDAAATKQTHSGEVRKPQGHEESHAPAGQGGPECTQPLSDSWSPRFHRCWPRSWAPRASDLVNTKCLIK